jgi:hypothetical protein
VAASFADYTVPKYDPIFIRLLSFNPATVQTAWYCGVRFRRRLGYGFYLT